MIELLFTGCILFILLIVILLNFKPYQCKCPHCPVHNLPLPSRRDNMDYIAYLDKLEEDKKRLYDNFGEEDYSNNIEPREENDPNPIQK